MAKRRSAAMGNRTCHAIDTLLRAWYRHRCGHCGPGDWADHEGHSNTIESICTTSALPAIHLELALVPGCAGYSGRDRQLDTT